MASDRPFIPLVDTHAHVFSRGLPFIPNAVHHFERDYTIEDFIGVLDTAGIRYAALAAASFLGTYSDYTLQALRDHGRLRATVIVDPEASASQLRDLNEAGVVGIRLAVANMQESPDLRSRAYRKLLQRIAEFGWHVHLFARPDQLPGMLSALAEAEVKLVLDHFGIRGNGAGPGSENFRAVLDAMGNGRTWVKLSAPYWSDAVDHRRVAQQFLHEAGVGRLLWASDWPFQKLNGRLDYRQAVDWLADWLPDGAVLRQIDANALDLYRFPPV